jgi:hypothetical protein
MPSLESAAFQSRTRLLMRRRAHAHSAHRISPIFRTAGKGFAVAIPRATGGSLLGQQLVEYLAAGRTEPSGAQRRQRNELPLAVSHRRVLRVRPWRSQCVIARNLPAHRAHQVSVVSMPRRSTRFLAKMSGARATWCAVIRHH